MNDGKLEVLMIISNSLLGQSIRTKTRKREVINARYVFSHIANKYLEKGSSEIGRFLRLDHASIINYLKKFDGVYKTDYELRDLHKKVMQEVKELDPNLIDYSFQQIQIRKNFHQRIINTLNKKQKELIIQ